MMNLHEDKKKQISGILSKESDLTKKANLLFKAE